MSNHTPGPWAVAMTPRWERLKNSVFGMVPHPERPGDEINAFRIHVQSENTGLVSFDTEPVLTLIVAAPALYEAAKAAREWMVGIDEGYSDLYNFYPDTELLRQLRDAIAQAEGESK